jgi:hypothetical protein
MDAWLQEYSIPFLFGERPRRNAVADIHSATCAVVHLGAQPFLLTAWHVVEEALQSLEGNPKQHCMVGEVELRIARHQVRHDSGLDLATLPLTGDQFAKLTGGQYKAIRPPTWPPPVPPLGGAIVMAGYPKLWRTFLSYDDIDFGGFSLLGVLELVKEDELAVQLNAIDIVETRASPDSGLGPPGLPGLSGGPAFLVQSDPRVVLAPQFCGVVKQGWSPGGAKLLTDRNVIVRLARVDRINRDGTIAVSSGQ